MIWFSQYEREKLLLKCWSSLGLYIIRPQRTIHSFKFTFIFLCRLLVKLPYVKIMVRVIRFMKRTNTNVAVHLALQELTAKRYLVSSIAQTLAFGPQSLHYAKKSKINYIPFIFFMASIAFLKVNHISYMLSSNYLKK